MNEDLFCRICGYEQVEPTWSEQGTPSHLICHCCGAEFGLDDETIESVLSFRIKWIAGGKKWFVSREKPSNWDFELQFQNIPSIFR